MRNRFTFLKPKECFKGRYQGLHQTGTLVNCSCLHKNIICCLLLTILPSFFVTGKQLDGIWYGSFLSILTVSSTKSYKHCFLCNVWIPVSDPFQPLNRGIKTPVSKQIC